MASYNPIYIYNGHSSFGDPNIAKHSFTDGSSLEPFMYIQIPENFRIVTMCNFGQTTNTKTTALFSRAVRLIKDFNQVIEQLFDYDNLEQKNSNITNFSKILVSNFLIWSLSKKQLSPNNFYSSLKMLPRDIIDKIIESWQMFSNSDEKPTKAWSSNANYLTKLHSFDFITEEIIQMVLTDVKINISVYKSDDIMKLMCFDDLCFFEHPEIFSIFRSGFFSLQDYQSLKSLVFQTMTKPQFEASRKMNEREETTKMRLAFKSRSQINVEKKFPRFFVTKKIFESFESGTFIIPSCGIVNKTFAEFFETNNISTDSLDFFK